MPVFQTMNASSILVTRSKGFDLKPSDRKACQLSHSARQAPILSRVKRPLTPVDAHVPPDNSAARVIESMFDARIGDILNR